MKLLGNFVGTVIVAAFYVTVIFIVGCAFLAVVEVVKMIIGG